MATYQSPPTVTKTGNQSSSKKGADPCSRASSLARGISKKYASTDRSKLGNRAPGKSSSPGPLPSEPSCHLYRAARESLRRNGISRVSCSRAVGVSPGRSEALIGAPARRSSISSRPRTLATSRCVAWESASIARKAYRVPALELPDVQQNKLERETAFSAPSTNPRVEFIYRLG